MRGAHNTSGKLKHVVGREGRELEEGGRKLGERGATWESEVERGVHGNS
jgi:hypothetical protein